MISSSGCGTVRLCAAWVSSAIGCNDRGGDADQQDGARFAQGLRPNAGAALRHFDGVVRQRRRLLPLLIFGRAWLRPYRAGRYLRPRLPTDRRGTALRRVVAAKEDPPHRHDRALMELAQWTIGSTNSARSSLARSQARSRGIELQTVS